MVGMNATESNVEHDDHAVMERIARTLRTWNGPIVIVSHVDPDGDALGSSLALKRALDTLGKTTTLPLEPPRFLAFLAQPGELSGPLPALPDGALLVVLDVADAGRMVGAPAADADTTINIDHHGTNDSFGDLALVQPRRAATAVIVKELIEALGVPWTPAIATPCLTGMLTDTGNFRFGNTDRDVLSAAGDLIDAGVAFSGLTDRLQWRHPDYFRMLGMVMDTVAFDLEGRLVTARLTHAMRDAVGDSDDDSEDFVGQIRYAEGALVAALLKERDGAVKLSVRTRDGVSAQAICLELGGGGHVAAAGATVQGDMDEAVRRLREATLRELERQATQPAMLG
jgi:phosphoesterase RecJ-like protein